MEYLHRLLNLPQITISQLEQRRKASRNVSTYRANLQVQKKQNLPYKNIIDVKQPYYIDRFKQYQHYNCDQNGKCLACEYQKLQKIKLTEKKYLPKYKRYNISNYNKQIEKYRKQPRQPLINSKKQQLHFRASEGSQPNVNFSFEQIISHKISALTAKQKQEFYRSTQKYCNDPQVLKLFADYLQQKNFPSCDKEAMSIKLIFKLEEINFQKQFMNKQFFNYVNKKFLSKKYINELKKSHKKVASIKQIKSLESRKQLQKSYKLIKQAKKRKGNINNNKIPNNKKKVIIADSSSDSQQIENEAKDIYTQLFENKFLTQQLNEEIKQSLSILSNKRYRMFRKTLTNLDELIGAKLAKQQQQIINQKIVKTLQSASSWMKNAINSDDEHQMQKCKDIDQFLNITKNINKRRKSISSRKNTSQKLISQSNIKLRMKSNRSIENNNNEYNNDRKIRRRKNSSKKSSICTNQNQNNKMYDQQYEKNSSHHSHVSIQSSIYSNFSSNSSTNLKSVNSNSSKISSKFKQNNLQLQFQSERSNRSNGKHRKIDKRTSRISSIMAKRNSYPKQDGDNIQQEQEKNFAQNKQQNLNIDDKILTQKSISSKKQIMRVNYSILQTNYEKDEEKQKLKMTQIKDKRKIRKLLRMKVTQLLKNNNNLILRVQQYLRKMNQEKLIIKKTDCVLTQKKKIRAILQLIKQLKGQNENNEKSTNQINEIMQYLSLYEQTCKILTQKRQKNNQNNKENENLRTNNLINKNQLFHQFKFFNLAPKFKYGDAQDQDMQFTYEKLTKKDKSWEIQCKNMLITQDSMKSNKLPKSINTHKKSFSQLLQTDMNCNLQKQLLIIPKNKICFKKLRDSIQQKTQHNINPFKLILNENKKQRRDFYKKYYPNTFRKSAQESSNNLQQIFSHS